MNPLIKIHANPIIIFVKIQFHNSTRNPNPKPYLVQSVNFVNNKATPPSDAHFLNACQETANHHPNPTLPLPHHHPTSQWLLDSGASHHVTADLKNLSRGSNYSGFDNIMIGDGTGSSFTPTGSTNLSSSSKSFILSNVLCAPDMKKNLISVSQFCLNNNAPIEFLPNSFYVKDLCTGAILLQGKTRDGVYEWLRCTLQQTVNYIFFPLKHRT